MQSTIVGEMGPPSPADGSPRTFELLRRWQDYLAVSGHTNENTRRQYRRTLIAFIADTLLELSEVTEDDVVAYLVDTTPRGGRRAMVLRALHSFYRFAERRRLLADNPVRAIPIPRQKYGKAPTLNRAEREVLFAAAEAVDPRARPALELMYATGGRISAVCALRVPDVYRARSGRRWVHFAVTKDDHPYDVPLGPLGEAAFDRLVELADYRPRHAVRRLPTLVGVGPGTVWGWVHRAQEASGVRAWPHLLRHAYASDALADVDDRTFAAMMGHRDASQRRRYAAPREEAMEAAAP